jgi:hypothetical protein
MSRVCLIVLTTVVLSINSAAQNTVGKIVYLDGTARLKQVNGKIETLSARDFVRNLQPNQKLKLDNGQMQIVLCDGKKPPIKSDKWFTIPSHIICSQAANSPIQRALRMHFDVAARQRGPDSFILFPIESKEFMDVVRPETALLRWGSSPPLTVDLSINVIGAENVAWQKTGVSTPDGVFTNDELKNFLKAVREKYPEARLQLKIRTTTTENTAIFQVLPKEKEEALQREIAGVQEQNKVIAHLVRAEIYFRYKLFNEAATEYEEALKLSPESIELLRDTAGLQEQAGNLNRSNELQTQIERLTEGKE